MMSQLLILLYRASPIMAQLSKFFKACSSLRFLLFLYILVVLEFAQKVE